MYVKSRILSIMTSKINLTSPPAKFSTSFAYFKDKLTSDLAVPDPLQVATGMYKREIVEILEGEQNPFSAKTFIRKGETKEKPNMIPSAFEQRMVGCLCEEDSPNITWMWLRKGETKHCQCGFWFQLYYEPPLADFIDYSTPVHKLIEHKEKERIVAQEQRDKRLLDDPRKEKALRELREKEEKSNKK